MKRIKHNDLTHYFLRPHEQLPRAYLDSCEKFFRELKNLKLARLTAANVQEAKAASSKRQAKKVLDSHKIPDIK
jgi:inorganic pyrophosphatase